jgi:excisionase family DNA binding protein
LPPQPNRRSQPTPAARRGTPTAGEPQPTSTATAIPAQTTTTGTADDRQAEALLTPGEVAALFRVDPKTVTRWAKAGHLTCIRTLGGHRRYPAAQFTTALTPTTQTPNGATDPADHAPR